MNGTPATADKAIQAALNQQWDLAVDCNNALLSLNEHDIDALNRIGFAYIHLGKQKQAKEVFEKVLTLDKYNQIAQRNLTKLKNKGNVEVNGTVASPLMFLEEPGKTKVVACVKLAPAATLAAVRCGQEVHMKVKKHTIEIRDDEQVYLAALPDDMSFKLSRLIDGGNQYVLIVRSVGKNSLSVFIRETVRGKKFVNQPSFTPTSTYVPTTRAEDQTEKPDTSTTGEEEQESGNE